MAQSIRAFEAVARIDGKVAGHVCYGTTRDSCDQKARKLTRVSFRVRQIQMSREGTEKLRAVGKL